MGWGLTAMIVAAAPAWAVEAEAGRQPALLAAADADRDGTLSAAELRIDRERQVTRFDGDRDGRLSPDEYAAWWLEAAKPRLERLFRADDGNKDGAVTLDELVERSNLMLHRRDRDGDGLLSADELRPRRRHAASPTPAASVSDRPAAAGPG